MLQRIEQTRIAQAPVPKPAAQTSGPSFRTVLDQVQSGLKVSAHAQERIRSRNIQFGPEEMARMEAAAQKAEAKGCRESLVMLDNNAFVVSVRNKTIVTAMDGMNVKENVFTNA